MLLLCLLVCESCVAEKKKIKDAGREASCLSYTSPRRAGDRSAVCLGFVVRAWRLLA